MSKRISVMFVVLSILVNFVGCVGYGRLTPIDSSHYVSQPVDENKDGAINEEDVKLLEQKSSEYFDSCAIQYKKGGIELGKEKDIPLIYILRIIDTEENIKTLEENLTVAEWKKLVNGRDELNRVVR
jgi:hypothetical protein